MHRTEKVNLSLPDLDVNRFPDARIPPRSVMAIQPLALLVLIGIACVAVAVAAVVAGRWDSALAAMLVGIFAAALAAILEKCVGEVEMLSFRVSHRACELFASFPGVRHTQDIDDRRAALDSSLSEGSSIVSGDGDGAEDEDAASGSTKSV
jgi:hypothetical protein